MNPMYGNESNEWKWIQRMEMNPKNGNEFKELKMNPKNGNEFKELKINPTNGTDNNY